MPATPWISAQAPRPGQEYLALISYLPLQRYRATPSFFRYTAHVRRQLRTARGLIGYSFDAQVFARDFWTLSVWEDSISLMEFVRANPHGEIMRKLAPHMGKTQFARWTVTAAEIPPRWPDAKSRVR